jgi:hypothetical protein
MKIKQTMGWGIAAFLGMVVLSPSARADVYMGSKGQRAQMPTIKSAEDAVEKLPVFSKIPKSFIIGDGLHFKLSGQELQIDHMGTRSRAPYSKRTCMVGISYAAPVAFFGTRVDLPLMHAQSFRMSDWGMNTLGDYVARFSKDAAVQHPTIGLSIRARF